MGKDLYFKCMNEKCNAIRVERKPIRDGARCSICRSPLLPPMDDLEIMGEQENAKWTPLETITRTNNVVLISNNGIDFDIYVHGEKLITGGGAEISCSREGGVRIRTTLIPIHETELLH